MTATDLRCLRRFEDFPDRELEMIFSKASIRELAAGEVWLSRGGRFSILWRGALRLGFVAPSGQYISLRIVESGDLLGAPAAFSDFDDETYQIVADTPGVLLTMTSTQALHLFEECPSFRKMIVKTLSRMVLGLSERVFEYATMSVGVRLQSELLRLAVRGRKIGGHIVISPAPKHETLATQIGATREVVSRFLRELNAQGIVRSRRGEIVILDYERLKSAVEQKGGRVEALRHSNA